MQLVNCAGVHFVLLHCLLAQVGSSSARKTALVRTLAYCCGQKLVEMPVNSAMDTTELLGGFEQVSFCMCLLTGLVARPSLEYLWHSVCVLTGLVARPSLVYLQCSV